MARRLFPPKRSALWGNLKRRALPVVSLSFATAVLLLTACISFGQQTTELLHTDDPELYFGFFSFQSAVEKDIWKISDPSGAAVFRQAAARHLNISEADLAILQRVAGSTLDAISNVTSSHRTYLSNEAAAWPNAGRNGAGELSDTTRGTFENRGGKSTPDNVARGLAGRSLLRQWAVPRRTSTLAGFQSSSLSLYVDYPQTTQLGSVQDNGLPGPPPGYLSANTLKLISKCGNTMFEMDVHEQFPANPSACGGSANWTDPVPQSQWGSWTTDNNGQFTDTVGYACSGCSPLSTIPGPLQTPPKALSTQANAHASQFIYVGSRDIQNLGKYFTAAPNMQVRYTDHGRDQPGTWTCP